MGKFGIKDQVRDFGDITTIHGIKDFITAKSKVMMVVWSVVMLAAFGACCWQLQQTITSYMSKPTAISTSIYELPELPLFNLHVLNAIDLKKLETYGLNGSHVEQVYASFPLVPLAWYLGTSEDDAYITQMLEDIDEARAKYGFQDFQKFMKAIAMDPSAVVSVQRGMMVDVSVEMNELGPFYQVAMSTSRMLEERKEEQPPNGYQTSLIVRPRIGIDPTTIYFVDNPYAHMARGNLAIDSALYVSVGQGCHNIVEWFMVNEGAQLIIETQVMKVIKGCNNNFDSEAECRNQCLLDALPKPQKECEWFWRKANTSSNLCKGWIRFDPSKDDDRNRCRAGRQCQPTCTKYTHSISKASTGGAGESGDIEVNITVRSLQVMMLEEYASYSAISLFGNVGGILSLYLGASIVSLLQLVYFCAFHRHGAVQPAT